MRRRAIDLGPHVAVTVPALRPRAIAHGCATAAAVRLLAWRGRQAPSAAGCRGRVTRMEADGVRAAAEGPLEVGVG